MTKHIFSDSTQFTGYTCAQMRQHYNFPAGLDGSGQTIGIAEWASGYSQADIDAFCRVQSLPPCAIEYVVIDGVQNSPDAECTLDIEIAHGMAPGAKIRLYEAPSGPDYQTFWHEVVALLRFVLADPDRPSTLSISYGDAEKDWTKAQVQEADTLIAQLVARGTVVLVASGDQGALGMHNVLADKDHTQNADAPATCPSAVAVGGTTLRSLVGPEVAGNESGWFATGGGVSAYFKRPAYQDAVSQYPGRGEPDFSMLADPFTGWQIVFGGKTQSIGGTSASCPAAAALIACINQARARHGLCPVGDILPTIYAHPEAFRPVTQGDNSFLGVQGYAAKAPWSPCCGLGVPDAAKFVSLFVPQEVTPVPKPDKPAIVRVNGQEIEPATIRGGEHTYAKGAAILKAMGDPEIPVRLFTEGIPGAKIHSDNVGGQEYVDITCSPKA